MIADNDLHTEFFCQRNLLIGTNATVNGDDQINAFVMELLDRVAIEPIALIKTIGNVDARSVAKLIEKLIENG